ncbi:hypothetical protein ACJJTC_001478 [Scirpophaga incertulas]
MKYNNGRHSDATARARVPTALCLARAASVLFSRRARTVSALLSRRWIVVEQFECGPASKFALHKATTEADKKLTPLNLHDRQTQTTEDIVSLHGRHRSHLGQPHVDKDKSNEWLKRGELFPETEGFMLAIQDEVKATRNYRKHIIKDINQQTDLCRHYNAASETIQHITSAC